MLVSIILSAVVAVVISMVIVMAALWVLQVAMEGISWVVEKVEEKWKSCRKC